MPHGTQDSPLNYLPKGGQAHTCSLGARDLVKTHPIFKMNIFGTTRILHPCTPSTVKHTGTLELASETGINILTHTQSNFYIHN